MKIPMGVLELAARQVVKRNDERIAAEEKNRKLERERQLRDPDYIRRVKRKKLIVAARGIAKWLFAFMRSYGSNVIFAAHGSADVILFMEKSGSVDDATGFTLSHAGGSCRFHISSSLSQLRRGGGSIIGFCGNGEKIDDLVKDLFDKLHPLFLLELAAHFKSGKVWENIKESLKMRDR